MTQVRLYDGTEGGTTVLGDVPFRELDSVLLSLKHWGLSRGDGQFIDTNDLFAIFKVDASGAYFQVTFE